METIQRDELYSSAGVYSSAFLKMHVHCTEDLVDLAKLSVHAQAAYFHEYVHYMQDISCTYGLMNICAIVDFVKLANDNSINSSSAEFIVPFEPQASSDNSVKANWHLKSIYLGGGKHVRSLKKLHGIYKTVQPVLTNNGNLNVDKIIFDFEDVDGNLFKYSFGALCVTESMAYEMEKALYPGILPRAAEMPYDSVRIICDKFFPGFTKDPLNIIALCDACLMTFNPGAFLFDTVQEMVQMSFSPKSPVDVYKFVYGNATFNHNGFTTIQQLLFGTATEAVSQLGDYFTTSIFGDNRKWINYVITSAVDLRIINPYFMLDIANGGPIVVNGAVNNSHFVSTLTRLGSPAVVNDIGEMTFIQPPAISKMLIRPEFLWAFKQVYQIHKEKLTQGTYQCELIGFCNKSAEHTGLDEYTDGRCRYDPWSRANDQDAQLCTFAQVWKSWGLMGKVPISAE